MEGPYTVSRACRAAPNIRAESRALAQKDVDRTFAREKLSLRRHRLLRKKQSNGLLILLDCANRESVLKPNVLGASPLWRQEGTSLEFQVGCACSGRNGQAVLDHKLRSPGIQRGVLIARRNRVVVQKRVPIE